MKKSPKKSIGANTLLYPTPVVIIGSYDKTGKTNGMTASWTGICCSKPPCITVSIQKSRHSFDSILENKAYTINIASEEYAAETDFFGMASGKRSDKFQISKLTAIKSEIVNAPYIEEFPVILECKLVTTFELGVHTQFIGEILDVKANENILNEKGLPDIKSIKPFMYDPGNGEYYGVGELIGDAFSLGKKYL